MLTAVSVDIMWRPGVRCRVRLEAVRPVMARTEVPKLRHEATGTNAEAVSNTDETAM